MFSGQGSQYYQMGQALLAQNDEFRQSMLSMDQVVRRLTGHSVVQVLYQEDRRKAEAFDRLLLSHPALFMVEYALARALIAAGVVPDATLGASAGTFAAATVAGCLEVDDALAAVVQQARIFEACCEPGGMLAVLGEPALYERLELAGRSELASVNFSSHFVVSAPSAELDRIAAELDKRLLIWQRLPVPFAFHSRWIDSARSACEDLSWSVRCRSASLPLLCCSEADVVVRPGRSYFWDIARRPIRFGEAIAKLERQGPCRYIDVGPAGTLSTLLKHGLPADSASRAHMVLTPYGQDVRNFNALVAMGAA